MSSFGGRIACAIGDLGAGKTLYVFTKAIEAAQHGREVHMNFQPKPQLAIDRPDLAVHLHYLDDFYGFLQERERQSYLTPEFFEEFQDLFVIDEASAVWNARRAMTSFQIMLVDYITISRKLGLELLMSSQLARKLDVQVKILIALWIQATKFYHEGEYYFRLEYYSPEYGDIKTTWLLPDEAKKYYPYYSTTGPTSTGVILPPELEREERAVTAKQFKAFKKDMGDQFKEVNSSLRELKREIDAFKREMHGAKPLQIVR